MLLPAFNQTSNAIPILKHLINGAHAQRFSLHSCSSQSMPFPQRSISPGPSVSEMGCFRVPTSTKGMIWENIQIRSYQNCFRGVRSPFWLRNRVTVFHCILKSSFGNEPEHFKSKLVFRRMTFLFCLNNIDFFSHLRKGNISSHC